MSSIEYLDEERKKLWAEILVLREMIEKRTPDYEQDAKQASKKSSEFRNKCEATKNEANEILENLKVIAEAIRQSNERATGLSSQLTEKLTTAQKSADGIQVLYDELIPQKDAISSNIDELTKLFANYATFSENLKKLNEIYSSTSDVSSKVGVTVDQLNARKNEIDKLYYAIIGYKQTDPKTGEEVEVEGLKKKLENSYVELKTDLDTFSERKNTEFSDTLTGWKNEYQSVLNQIKELLPHALTTGLSYAYSAKKDAEIIECGKLKETFDLGITGLILVSLIPFGVSVYLLVTGVTLDAAILKMPRLVLSILPLYIPVLWVAYSANRKMNLSKRLIEEYTHKEVLSKTFEGLAQQIQNIKDSEISDDLKTRLLYNILEVSSENPGKLISDYNKSDHPLMDALDKSVKLTNAIDKLSKIPGMSKLVNVLDGKSRKIIEDEATKAEAGIEKALGKA